MSEPNKAPGPLGKLPCAICRDLLPLVQVAEALAQKYDVVVTNPPYLGNSRFSPILEKYIKSA